MRTTFRCWQFAAFSIAAGLVAVPLRALPAEPAAAITSAPSPDASTPTPTVKPKLAQPAPTATPAPQTGPCAPLPGKAVTFSPCVVSAPNTVVTIVRGPNAPEPTQMLLFKADGGQPAVAIVNGVPPNFTFTIQRQLCRGTLVRWTAYTADSSAKPLEPYATLTTNC